MRKKHFILLLLLLPVLLFAQTDNEDKSDKPSFGFTGQAGYMTQGNNTWTQIRLMPEVALGKFAFGLDIEFLLDPELNLRSDDWDEPIDLLSKIYYVKYGNRSDSWYLQAAGFPSYTLAHGLIMNEYNNRLLYPDQKNIGAMIGIKPPLSLHPGLEVFCSNLAKADLLAAQVSFEPFALGKKEALLPLRIGVTYVTDRNQYAKYDDKDKDKVPDIIDPDVGVKNTRNDIDGDGLLNNTPTADGIYTSSLDPDIDNDGVLDSPAFNPYVSTLADIPEAYWSLLDNHITTPHWYGKRDEISVYGAWFDLPIVQTGPFLLSTYGEFAQIDGYGKGMSFPGFETKFLIFDLNLEMRRFGNQFLPSYFDQYYEDQRSRVVDTSDPLSTSELVTKESTLSALHKSLGWYGGLKAHVANVVMLEGSYQDMYGEGYTAGKSVRVKASVDPVVIPKIQAASICYSQSNVQYLSLQKVQTPSAKIDGTLIFRLSDFTNLIAVYSERYIDQNGDNKIKGTNEILKTYSLGVGIRF